MAEIKEILNAEEYKIHNDKLKIATRSVFGTLKKKGGTRRSYVPSGLTRRIEDGFLSPAFAGACFAGMTEAANFYREYIC